MVSHMVVPGNNDATVRSWALSTSMFGQLSPLSTYLGHTGPVRTVTYARMGDSKRIVSGSDDAEIGIWDGDSDRLVRKICAHEAAILSVSVSDDKIFSGSKDKTLRVWDLDTGDNISIIYGHTAPINSIKVSQDGHRVVSVSDDGSVRILDGQTGKPLTLPRWMSSRILCVDLSRDGKLIAFSGLDLHTWCPDMAQPTVWPDGFIQKMHGREFCPIDDQGILADATLHNDGWLHGPMDQFLCWIPPAHQQGLLLRSVRILGARETALDMRNFVHGTNWEQCEAK
jgi:WD40 repeat protein